MRLNCLCYCRDGTIGGGIEGKKRVDFYSFLGDIPYKPASVGQVAIPVPLETACVNVWRFGQLKERNQAYWKSPALWAEALRVPSTRRLCLRTCRVWYAEGWVLGEIFRSQERSNGPSLPPTWKQLLSESCFLPTHQGFIRSLKPVVIST